MRDNTIFFVGSMVTGLFGYIYQFAAGRLLGPSGYAVVASVFSIVYLFTVPNMVVTTVAVRYAAVLGASADSPRMVYLFRRMTLALGVLGLAVALGFAVVTPLVAQALQVPSLALIAVAPTIVLSLVAPVSRGILQGQGRFASLSAVLVADAFGRAALCVLLIKAGYGPTGALVAVTAAAAISYLLAMLPLRKLIWSHQSDPIAMSDPLRFSAPAAGAVMGVVLLSSVDIILVKHFMAGSLQSQAGIYASVATLGRIVYYATFSISGVMFPSIIARRARNASTTATLLMSVAGVLVIGAVAVAALGAFPRVALLPFGASFATAAAFLPLFAAAMGLLALSNLLVNYMLAVSDRRFLPVLLGAVATEATLISVFHASVGIVVWIVFLVLLGTAAILSALVASDALTRPPAPGASISR